MRRAVIGVDIGSYSVKCCTLEEVGDCFYVKKKRSFSVPPLGEQEYPQWLRATISEFIEETKLKQVSLSFSLPENAPKTIIRFLDVQKLDPKELAKSIPYEIEEKTLIEDVASVHYKWQRTYEGRETDSVLLAVMNDAVLQGIRKARRMGWRLRFIAPHLVSLGRIVKGNVGVIDFGHTGTRFMVYRDGQPHFSKEITIGGRDITQRIADNYVGCRHISETEERLALAAEVKHQRACIVKGFEMIENDPVARQLSKIIETQVQELADELKQAFRTVQMEEGFAFDRLFYTGGAAELRYLTNFIGTELGFDLERLNPTADKQAASDEDISRAGVAEPDFAYVYAYGAALCDEVPYLSDINFVGVKPARHVDTRNIVAGALAFALLLDLGSFAVEKVYAARLKSSETLLAKTNSELGQVQSYNQTLRNEINGVAEIESALYTLSPEQKKWLSETLFVLSKVATDGVAVNNIVLRDSKITIEGYAINYSQIGFFVIPLEKSWKVSIDKVYDLEETGLKLNSHPLTKGFSLTLTPQ